jgi:hypothetical protein
MGKLPTVRARRHAAVQGERAPFDEGTSLALLAEPQKLHLVDDFEGGRIIETAKVHIVRRDAGLLISSLNTLCA